MLMLVDQRDWVAVEGTSHRFNTAAAGAENGAAAATAAVVGVTFSTRAAA